MIFSCSKSLVSMSICVINHPKTWQLETPPVKSFSWFPASVQLRFGQAAAPQRTPSHLVLGATYPPGPAISQGTRETPSRVLSVAPRGEGRRGCRPWMPHPELTLPLPPMALVKASLRPAPKGSPPVGEPHGHCRGPFVDLGGHVATGQPTTVLSIMI